MTGDTEGPVNKTIKCPRCKKENFSWLSRCQWCGNKLHKEDEELPEFEGRGAGFWYAFIIGLIGTGLSGFFTYRGLSGPDTLPYFIVSPILSVIGLILCWKWLRVSGLLLILGGILFPVSIIIIPGVSSDIFFVFGLAMVVVLVTIPLLISGIIFIWQEY